MTKAIMVQGTMSNAGKSVLTAALCRIFLQDGYSPAPFKSQNMALNSFITREGLEMGRAQVMQAEAARVEPSVRMNPILLKPTSDQGSQLIVNGEVVGNFSAAEYFAKKKQLIPQIMQAYQSLAAQHDIIVLEGAGSPAEINLKQDDIVNMGMAKLAKAPVLLCGDIDRGGVFASLYGTVELLEKEERAMVKGFIINKFRGDESLLAPGLAMLEQRTGIPVLGVIPWLDVDLEDEDSLSGRLACHNTQKPLDVAVIRLPRISNFTDLNALERFGQVGVRYVEQINQLGRPDLMILPGTKNTMADLRWLRQCGLEAGICRLCSEGVPLIGICGGYQMLGQSLSDPYGVEEGGQMRGMGLLPCETTFSKEKSRTRVSGQVVGAAGFFAPLEGAQCSGYEIHMGRTVPAGDAPDHFLQLTDAAGKQTRDGLCSGNVLGSYLHGLFDEGDFAERLVDLLAQRKGLSKENAPKERYAEYKQRQYDKLAFEVRRHLDLKRVYRILQEGIE
ncbi:MAG: cobyric acid synthase [Pygmaiobacter massiliensis]|nr:cobyric acid synthase [Pygmaiobacter massiliensis]